jgi:GntR family transcriptional regulator/MocR family aminotransferase
MFVSAIKKELTGVLEFIDGAAGTRVIGLLPLGVADTEIAREIEVAGLRVKALSQCYVRPPARGGLILDYANLDPDAVHRAVRALASAIGRHAGLLSAIPSRRHSEPSDAHTNLV